MFLRILTFLLSAFLLPCMGMTCEGLELSGERYHGSPLCVPERPKRVVVLDQSFSLGIGLELGLPIVGAPLTRMSDEILSKQAQEAGVTDLGFVTEPSLERIVALQPDMIIAFTGNAGLAESVYPMLSSLAPTVLDISGDWRGFYDVIAQLTGREAEVAPLFAAYEARVQDIRARMPEDTVSIIRITPWDFQVYLDSAKAYAPFEVASEAGLKRTSYETDPSGQETLKRPDWEELAALDGDILLYIVGGTNDSATSGRLQEVTESPLWQMLPAVQSGRVHPIDPAIWMEFSGLPSAHRVLDDIERLVIGAK